ncbi:MAG: DUF4838 domain-containing protein, partial [Acidobacteriota bacterium]|nr:DUF4838 domain-containing protein [Acidobacteriota bacterium]
MSRVAPARIVVSLVAALALPPVVCAGAVVVARNGEAKLPIVVPLEATPQETTAALELAAYLEKVTAASFAIRAEEKDEIPAIYVGDTSAARALGIDPAALGAEEWVIRTTGGRLVLAGGRPRGTLYAVYHLLEDVVGVRWWTPYDESVPGKRRLRFRNLAERGEPAFAYRDVHGIDGPPVFCARSRVNGHFARLSPEYGGTIGYGPPKQVHTFGLYVDPDEYFEDHPEYFSEIDGERTPVQTQLCLTNEDLRDLVIGKLRAYIEQSRESARAAGQEAPSLFAISPNDWARPCQCALCSAVVERTGAESGVLLDFVNHVAEAIEEEYPEVTIDTLGYYYTFPPPREIRPRDNVVVRVAGLLERDFSSSVLDTNNTVYREGVESWATIAPRMRIWDYTVTFGKDGDLPLPNLLYLAEDYRYYLDLGVDGLFVQHEHPISADLRDLKLWVLLKILEDPRQDTDRLIREFTDGYYGKAGKYVRRYLRLLDEAAGRHDHFIGHRATAEDYVYVDARFALKAAKVFDRAEKAVDHHPVLRRRVRHARLSLDRATLERWDALVG